MNIHEQARQTYLRAARLHDEAADFWDARSYPGMAARQREMASELRSAALVEQAIVDGAARRGAGVVARLDPTWH